MKGRSLDVFSGIAGISAAASPWFETAGFCDIEPFAQVALMSRMRTGEVDAARIFTDITKISENDLQVIGPLDSIMGGFPCQDISLAGKGAGLDGHRSGLFFEISRLAEISKVPFLFLENVPAIRTRGLNIVAQELDRIGYDTRWCIVAAYDVGAPHLRERWFCWARRRNTPVRDVEALKELVEVWDHSAPLFKARATGWNDGPATYTIGADPMKGVGDLERLGVNWPTWGTFSEGTLTSIEPWARRGNDGAASLFVPTATPDGEELRPTAAAMAKYNLWPTPRARDWRSGKMSDDLFEKRSQPLAEVATKIGNLPTPKAGSNRNSRKAIMGGHPNHPSKSDLSLEQAVECLDGQLPREVIDPSELPKRFRQFFPTPTNSTGGGFNGNGTPKLSTAAKMLPTPVASERSGINPNTGRGGGLSRAIKDEVGILPTPRAGKTTDEDPEVWQKRKDAGKVSTPPLSLAVKLLPTPQSTDDKTGLTPEQLAERQRKAEENGGKVQRMLRDEVKLPTPRGGEQGVGLCAGTGSYEMLEQLAEDGDITEEERKSMAAGGGGHLNSEFVEWMMGYRLGYTVIHPDYEFLLEDEDARHNACQEAGTIVADTEPGPNPTGEEWAEWVLMAEEFGIWWAEWPGVLRLVSDQPYRRHRLKALGNSVVPAQVRLAWLCLVGFMVPAVSDRAEQLSLGDFFGAQA